MSQKEELPKEGHLDLRIARILHAGDEVFYDPGKHPLIPWQTSHNYLGKEAGWYKLLENPDTRGHDRAVFTLEGFPEPRRAGYAWFSGYRLK